MKFIKGSIISKIIISLIIATSIPFLISNYLSSQYIGTAIKSQLVELNQNSMAITMSTLHSYFHELSLLGLSYFNDPTLVRLLSSKEQQTSSESVYISQRLEQTYASYNEIGSVSYKSALTNKQFNIRNTFNSKIEIPNFVDGKLSYQHNELQQPFQVTYNNREPRLRVNKPFIDISTREIIGLTTFDVKTREINKIIDSLTTSEYSPIYLFINDELDLLFTNNELTDNAIPWKDELSTLLAQNKLPPIKGAFENEEGSYVYYQDIQNHATITLVKLIPQSYIKEARASALSKTVSIQMISIIFVSVLAAIISYFMLRRIKVMLQHIKKLQMGNFHLSSKKKSVIPDELDLLEARFHEMAVELDELLNKQYRHQYELSQARLKMLQAQINPHFFYNTLQSIGTLAIKANARDVSDRLADFGALFRYSMDINREEVYLREEIEHLEHYITLQIGRFKQRLKFDSYYTEEAKSIIVPKMILQPLVENCIIHGLEKGNGTIEIQLLVRMDANVLNIEVIDTGKGITTQQIDQIKASYAEHDISTQQQGIGLTNVLKRLKIYYGAEFHWEITSTPYEKTVVKLSIPIFTTGRN